MCTEMMDSKLRKGIIHKFGDFILLEIGVMCEMDLNQIICAY